MSQRSEPSDTSLGALAIVATALSCGTTLHSLQVYLPTYNTPHTLLEGVAHPKAELPGTPGIARRVTFVMVDGLAFERAKEVEELGPLRRAGVLRMMRADFPSYTSPAITTFMTGVPPRDSGTRLNGQFHGVDDLDTVLLAGRDALVPLRIRSRGWEPFEKILKPPLGTDVSAMRIGLLAETLAASLDDAPALRPIDGRTPARAMDFIYLSHVDDAGHEFGGASRDYTDASHVAGAMVAKIARSLDLEQDALVVVSDHGHIGPGGHGGMEPEVTHAFFLGAGSIFRRGVELGERPMRDVASTISLLAGVRTPATNLGRPMLDAMALEDEVDSIAYAAPFDQATKLLCALSPSPRCAEVPALLARLRKPDPTAWPEAEALHDAITADRDRALATLGKERGDGRLARAAAILAGAALLAWVGLRRRLRVSGAVNVVSFVPPLINAGVFLFYLWTLGYGPSFSRMRPGGVFIQQSIPGGLLAVAAVALFAWYARLPRLSPWVLVLVSSIPFMLLGAKVGWDPTLLPDPLAGVILFELGPAVISASVGALVMEWIRLRRTAAR